MCEFVCQISILISAAAIVERKVFLVETIATRLTGKTTGRQRFRGGGGGHPHTNTPTSAVAEVLGFCFRPVQSCGGPDSFRPPLHSCPVAIVDCVLSKLQRSPSSRRLPAPGAWRDTSQPVQVKIADLHVQPSRWTLHSGDKVQPAWAFLLRPKKCPAGARKDMSPEAQLFRDPPSSSDNSSTPLKQRWP